MNRRGRVDEIFNIEINNAADNAFLSNSSSHSDLQSTNSRHPLTGNAGHSQESEHEIDDRIEIDASLFPPRVITMDHGNLDAITRAPGEYYIEDGSKSIKVKTINCMPSRLQRAFSIDGQILSTNITNDEIETLIQKIEKHDHLMEDSPQAEQLRMETIKSLPQALTIKRQVKDRLKRNVTIQSKSHKINRFKRGKYIISNLYNRCKSSVKNTVTNIELWYQSMKTIEGHFGSSVAAYFKFLRWLFILNIILLMLTIGFITIPQILFNSTMRNAEQVVTAGVNGTEAAGVVVQDGVIIDVNKTLAVSDEDNVSFTFVDLITAEGYFTNSILFYGHYTNLTVKPSSPSSYSLPYAYFLTMVCLYVATFVIVSVAMARSYRRSFIETYGGSQNLYAHKIFCSWDFGISIEKAARLKHISIFNEFKEMLHDFNKPEIEETRWKRLLNFSTHLTAHVLVFAMLAGLGVGMWIMLKAIGIRSDELSSWAAIYVSLVINLTMMILHSCFNYIAYMEDYKSPRVTLHINLLRNFLLELVIIGVLLGFWLTQNNSKCWETSIGQEIYRLVLIDFFITTIGASLIQGCRVLLSSKWPQIGLPEFDISRGTLGLVFNQTLLWVGLLFSPMLATIMIIKMFLTFYIKQYSLIYFCKAPTKLWRAAQTQTLYLVLIFLSLMGVIVLHSYVMTQVTVSNNCGPFRGHAFMYNIFVDGILELREGHVFWQIVVALTKPAVIGGVLLTMGVGVYYLRAKSKSRIAMVKQLKDMLYYESKDKEFLLSNISRVTQGREYMFDVEPNMPIGRDREIYTESSSTWRFNRNNSHRAEPDNLSHRQFGSHADVSQASGHSDSNVRNRRY